MINDDWHKELGKAVVIAFVSAMGAAVGTWVIDELREKFGTKHKDKKVDG